MRPVRLLALAVLFAGLTITPSLGHAGGETVVKVGQFSEAPIGDNPPTGWKPLTFPKIPKHTQYTVVREDDTPVIRARSEAAASGLIHKVKLDLKEYPIIQWRWKVLNVIKSSDVHRKEGDDYAARIYITFEYDPDKVSFSKRSKYKLGRLLLGDIPIAAINYIWESKTPRGTIVDNAYTDFAKMIVIESGQEKVGKWVTEERHVYEDYKKAFGEEPPLVNGVAIMTDTDNTGEVATSYYGDILFKKAQ
jgi:hypothetical protein